MKVRRPQINTIFMYQEQHRSLQYKIRMQILGKELLLFRDSFGSSIAPLLLENYSKITLIDLRYLSKDILENYIEFENQDVLFLYSTLVLNQNVLK